QSVDYGAAVGDLPVPDRIGYEFGGWFTQPDGNGIRYTSVTTYSMTGDVILYAQWTEGVTGVEDRLKTEVFAFPNPFAGALHLTGAEGCTLTVFTPAGAIVHTQKITGANETLSLEQLPAGLYLFRLEKDGKTKTLKMVKDGR
ncbi:MAG: InlB B-repeat-containing protein, partial [Bacteroidales bacterium]|nr:InlB B-repeat-containing protein [Bacteroidales bacterium]